MLDELDAIRAQWSALQPLPADAERRLDLSLDAPFVAASNAIEERGALSLSETEVFFESGLTSAGRRLEDFVALERHREALGEARSKARAGVPLSLDLIRALHFSLTRGLKDKDYNPGEWKNRANRSTTRRGRTFRYASPEAVPELMRDLVAGYEGLAARTHPIAAVAWFSYHFHLIHPFNEANGRISRLVSTFLLMKNGMRELIIDPRERGSYLDALSACDSTVPHDRLAPLYAGIETVFLVEFFADCQRLLLEEVVKVVQGEISRGTSDVAKNSRQQQRAILVRLRESAPDLAWRHDAATEVKKLHDRIVRALELATDDGPLYAIAPEGGDIVNDHSVDAVIRSALPSGGAGVIGQAKLSITPKPGSPVKLPPARVVRFAVAATRTGLHLASIWDDEKKAVIRVGHRNASQWSQSSLERHLAERLDGARREYDKKIVELNKTAPNAREAMRAVTTHQSKLATRIMSAPIIRPEEAPRTRRLAPTTTRLTKELAEAAAKGEPPAARKEPPPPPRKEPKRTSERVPAAPPATSPLLDGIRPSEPPLNI